MNWNSELAAVRGKWASILLDTTELILQKQTTNTNKINARNILLKFAHFANSLVWPCSTVYENDSVTDQKMRQTLPVHCTISFYQALPVLRLYRLVAVSFALMIRWSRALSTFSDRPADLYMLFTGQEVRMGKNCSRGLEYGPRPKAEGRTQDQWHSFFPYGPT